MKKIVSLIIILITLSFTTSDVVKSTSVTIAPESVLYVNGETNVNTKVKCNYDLKRLKKQIPVYYHAVDERVVFDKATLVLSNTCFDCGGNAINKDFQKLLKSDQHPEIFLTVKEIKHIKSKTAVEAHVDLNVAGVTNQYKIPVTIKKTKKLLLSGKLDIKLSDFKMKPPKKLFGIVSLKDDIEIKFQLAIQEY